MDSLSLIELDALIPISIYLDEVDLEELMASLSPSELQALVDEMAADPDDVHIPASVRYDHIKSTLDVYRASRYYKIIKIMSNYSYLRQQKVLYLKKKSIDILI